MAFSSFLTDAFAESENLCARWVAVPSERVFFRRLACSPLSFGAMRSFAALLLLVGLASAGCAAVRDDMRRAESSFDQARYEHVETWLSELEPSVPEMDRPLRARFYYLRGITAYRLGDKLRARHYLALSREEAGPLGIGLRSEWRTGLDVTLRDLGVAPLHGAMLPGSAPDPAVPNGGVTPAAAPPAP